MIDQSFTVNNFRAILDLENRKGIHLENELSIISVRDKNFEIKGVSKEIRRQRINKNYEKVTELKDQLKTLREEKETLLYKELNEIAGRIAEKNYKITLNKILIPGGKPIYTTDNTKADFFATRQLQRNISRLYKVKQSNRDQIVRQLIGILGDGFPKVVLRTDISSFYESVNQEIILRRINENLLTPLSKRLIRTLLRDYNQLTGNTKGVPRGIGVSAYLTEILMRDADKALSKIPSVSYYARYVDDIVIVFTPNISQGSIDFKNQVSTILEEQFELSINDPKTKVCDVRGHNAAENIEFLGYKIRFGQNLDVQLSTKKKDKYKNRINKIFDEFENHRKIEAVEARRYLIKRIRFLTGNTKLKNNKKNILVGIYYSNSSLSNGSCLNGLDEYLLHKINTLAAPNRLKEKLKKYTFIEGFEKKRFSPFKIKELSRITNIWKNT